VLAVLAYRMSIGVDLTDESYYVTFLDGWLKDGLNHSENLVVHQTAALLVYPAALLYTWIAGGERGLVLFLRGIYLAMACAAGLCQYLFIRCVRGAPIAWAVALLVVCFMPFGLPAPSYNTIGMFGMLSALAWFGVTALHRRSATYGTVAAMFSGLAWLLAVIAYPSMAVVLLALLALALLVARERSERVRLLGYAAICACFQLFGAGLLLVVYGWARLWKILQFSNALTQTTEGMMARLAATLDPFVAHPCVGALCLAAAALGVWLLMSGGALRRGLWPSLAVLAIVLASYATEPALWFPPHDVVLLLALVGIFTLHAGRDTDEPPVIGIIYATSFVGGLITTATSSNGIYNFPIGGLAAAALAPAVLVPRGARLTVVTAQCGMLLLIAGLFCASAVAGVYGEIPNPLTTRARRLDNGLFAGLLTSADRAAFITAATAAFDGLAGRGKLVVVVGRLPGIYLLTDASPITLASWDFSQFYGALPPGMDALMAAFYRVPAHRPDVVAVFTDPQSYPPPAWARDLLAGYVVAEHVSVGSWSLSLYVPAATG
jgi:hypothetical protein